MKRKLHHLQSEFKKKNEGLNYTQKFKQENTLNNKKELPHKLKIYYKEFSYKKV